jgi:hypothetical protein
VVRTISTYSHLLAHYFIKYDHNKYASRSEHLASLIFDSHGTVKEYKQQNKSSPTYGVN